MGREREGEREVGWERWTMWINMWIIAFNICPWSICFFTLVHGEGDCVICLLCILVCFYSLSKYVCLLDDNPPSLFFSIPFYYCRTFVWCVMIAVGASLLNTWCFFFASRNITILPSSHPAFLLLFFLSKIVFLFLVTFFCTRQTFPVYCMCLQTPPMHAHKTNLFDYPNTTAPYAFILSSCYK